MRAGLRAVAEHEVRHPYVEPGIDKADVRALADWLCMGDLAALPAAPSLSSRVETGSRITAPTLELVDAADNLVRESLALSTVRCRVRGESIAIELGAETNASLEPASAAFIIGHLTIDVSHRSGTNDLGARPPDLEPAIAAVLARTLIKRVRSPYKAMSDAAVGAGLQRLFTAHGRKDVSIDRLGRRAGGASLYIRASGGHDSPRGLPGARPRFPCCGLDLRGLNEAPLSKSLQSKFSRWSRLSEFSTH